MLRYDTDDDVNDAIVLPGDGDRVAYANDGDDAVIFSMSARNKLFSTDPFMREAKGVAIPSITGSRKHVLTMLRDQNAVAFDPLGGVFFAGGDDNLVWRFHGAPGPSPSMSPPVELDGNVEEILCTHMPAPGQTEASIVVALDTLHVEVVAPDGNVQASLAIPSWSAFSLPIRIALTPDDEVIAVMGGALMLFNPSDASVRPSGGYPRFARDWHFSVTDQDTVIATRGNPSFLHRVVHATADTADVATTVVGFDGPRSPPGSRPLPAARASSSEPRRKVISGWSITSLRPAPSSLPSTSPTPLLLQPWRAARTALRLASSTPRTASSR